MIDLKSLAVSKFVTPPTKNKVGHFVVDPFIGSTFLAVKLFNESSENILIYCANNFEVTELYNALVNFVEKDKVITIPSDELLRVEYLSESKDLLAQQIYGLNSILSAKHNIILLSPSSLYKYYPSKKTFIDHCIHIKVGETYGFENLKKKLSEACYSRVTKIDQSLQFAVRGDIIDVFSLNSKIEKKDTIDKLVIALRNFLEGEENAH